MDIYRLKDKGKTSVNVTLDTTLLKEMEAFKKKHGIKQLSPLINEVLWEWLKDDTT